MGNIINAYYIYDGKHQGQYGISFELTESIKLIKPTFLTINSVIDNLSPSSIQPDFLHDEYEY